MYIQQGFEEAVTYFQKDTSAAESFSAVLT